jgi:Spy/CpxP family protein refolding chaperone
MKNRAKWLMAALATVGLTGGVVAATTSDSGTNATPTPSQDDSHGWQQGDHGWRHRAHGWRHRHMHRRGPGLLGGALRHLQLSADQRSKVRSILSTARTQNAASRQSIAQNFAALHNPGDPNYTAALQAAQSRASSFVAQRSQVEKQIYGILTPEQKSQLPQVLTSIQSRLQERASHAGQHSG